MQNKDITGAPIERVLMVYPYKNDKYHIYMKTFRKVLMRTGIAKEDIHMLAAKDVDNFYHGADDVYTVAFLPESSALVNFPKEQIDKLFPLIENVALNCLYYYNSVGNLYGLMGNINIADTISNSNEILESLGIINKDGKILYNFEKGEYVKENDTAE